MMRWIILIFAATSVGCDGGNTAATAAPDQSATSAPRAAAQNSDVQLPVMSVDSRHSMLGRGNSGTPYVMSAGPGVVVDARDFHLNDPDRVGREPNVVRILYEGSEYFVPWPGRRNARCTLDVSTMKMLKGSPFTGFAPGKRAAVGIGFEATNEQTNRIDFHEFWVASVIFTSQN